MRETPVPNGELLGDRYRLGAPIAEGGVASVWSGVDEVLRRPVAIKRLLSRAEAPDPAATEHFLREARVMAAVQHRCVATVLDFGVHDGQPYLVMELLEGEPLDTRHPAGTATVAEVAAVASGVLAGLDAIHAAGIVHRDLKPANILIIETADGPQPVIVDFGIARSLRPADELRSVRTTEQGLVHGTPRYMAPEQARGFPTDARADVFSVGALLFELLAGTAPFDEGDPVRTLIATASGRAPTLRSMAPDVPASIAAVIDRALLPAPIARFQTAIEMRAALLRAATPHGALRDALRTSYEPGDSGLFTVLPLETTPLVPEPVAPEPLPEAEVPPTRRRLGPVAAVLGLLAAGLMAIGFASSSRSDDSSSAAPEAAAAPRLDASPAPSLELPAHDALSEIVAAPSPVAAPPASPTPRPRQVAPTRRAATRARPSIVLDPGF